MRNENDVKKNWNFRCTEHLNRLMTFISRWLTYVLLHANKVQHHQRTSIVAISKNEDAIQEYMNYKRGRSLGVALVAKLINLMIYFLVCVYVCVSARLLINLWSTHITMYNQNDDSNAKSYD